MKQIVLLLLFALKIGNSQANDIFISGAGASFPAPIYILWAERYHQLTDIQINYQPIGSGGGIKQVQAGTIDFGATDKPLSTKELEQYDLLQFPMILGAVVPVFNLPGIDSGQLKLTGQVLAKIFLGKITRWRDPEILSLNPKLSIPDYPITVIHRSESSGTTYLFTSYLSKVSLEWKKMVGCHSAVKWPVGLGAKGNEGASVYVHQKLGSISYVEYSFVSANGLNYASLKNKAGHFVMPEQVNFQASTEAIDWDRAKENLTDASGDLSWPIFGASYILIKRHVAYHNLEKNKQLLAFFKWAFEYGQIQAQKLQYVPLPLKAQLKVYQIWNEGFRYEKHLVLFP